MSEVIELAKKCGADTDREWSSQSHTLFGSKKKLEAFYDAAVQRGRELEREKYKLAFFVDPAALPLFKEAEMVYATASSFDGCTVPVYVNTPVPALRVEQTPVEPSEVYSPHTKVLP